MTREEQLRVAIADALDLALDGVQVSPWPLSNPTPPAIDVIRDSTEYDQTMAGPGQHHDWNFLVRVYVAFNTDIGAQRRLAEVCEQVKPAIEADRSLGGVAQSVHVRSQSGDKLYQHERNPNLAYLGREFSVFVMAP